jgi:hypothetical protein
MEIHHHPHIEKKGFKEYFFKMVMEFLGGGGWSFCNKINYR